jgi:adenine-specific DNA-methyltransferase
MAVPIPGKGKRSNGVKGHPADTDGFRLEYPGKKSAEEILATPAGRYVPNPAYVGGDNRLYHADNLAVLSALAQDASVAGKVKLVYIDPPFATASAFESRKQKHAYDDHLVGPVFVESLRERLVLIHRLLADDGEKR